MTRSANRYLQSRSNLNRSANGPQNDPGTPGDGAVGNGIAGDGAIGDGNGTPGFGEGYGNGVPIPGEGKGYGIGAGTKTGMSRLKGWVNRVLRWANWYSWVWRSYWRSWRCRGCGYGRRCPRDCIPNARTSSVGSKPDCA